VGLAVLSASSFFFGFRLETRQAAAAAHAKLSKRLFFGSSWRWASKGEIECASRFLIPHPMKMSIKAPCTVEVRESISTDELQFGPSLNEI
jgi:hypothetical protein